MTLELDGKRAIVTGGGTGIGYAIALELARNGVSVAITSRRQDVLEAAAERISADSGSKVLAVTADTGDDASVQSLVERVVAEFGGIDILVNNAAEQPAQHGSSYLDADDDWFQRQINVKVIGYLRTIRAVAPHLIENKWGRIVNIGGTASRRTASVIGSVRNASVTALTKNIADELGPHGINVTVVNPGPTRTERYIELEKRGDVTPSNILGRVIEPEEVAWVVAFLASPRSVAITGDGIFAGGGVPDSIYY
ncbi:SDR family NAD(P)-dependent oxidoreductase [Rhodococcoides yunnanense]|uniref:SDR family NAD(P)-dependent oxidoreductase n=1 Tax=Rhodococcoides yunnanense TaxID=278209 RepID=UPI000933D4C4|nr:SDR family oxidoreductase [Rhodococcus yunnanensis]